MLVFLIKFNETRGVTSVHAVNSLRTTFCVAVSTFPYSPRERTLVLLIKFRGGGVLLGILDGGVPPGCPNSDPISGQTVLFSITFFKLTRLMTWPQSKNYMCPYLG